MDDEEDRARDQAETAATEVIHRVVDAGQVDWHRVAELGEAIAAAARRRASG